MLVRYNTAVISPFQILRPSVVGDNQALHSILVNSSASVPVTCDEVSKLLMRNEGRPT
jgi:hypothetical protein